MSAPPPPDRSNAATTGAGADASSGYTLPAQPLIARNLSHVLALPALSAVEDLRGVLTSSVPGQEQGHAHDQVEGGHHSVAHEVARLLQCQCGSESESEADSGHPGITLPARLDALVELTRALALALALASPSPDEGGPTASTAAYPPTPTPSPAHLTAAWAEELTPQLENRLLLASCRVVLAYAPRLTTALDSATPAEALRKAQSEVQSARTALLAFLKRIPRTRPHAPATASHDDGLYAALAQQCHLALAAVLLALSNLAHWLDGELRPHAGNERTVSQEVRRLLSYRDKALHSARLCGQVAEDGS